MNDIRHKILKSLLTFDRPLGELRQKLSKLEWDSKNSLIRLSADHVRLVALIIVSARKNLDYASQAPLHPGYNSFGPNDDYGPSVDPIRILPARG